MRRSSALIELGSSSISILAAKKDTQDSHFRWLSIQKFIYFAFVYSSTLYNFDIFSQVCDNVRLIDFIIIESTVGLPYLCMDSFIKQFTRRYDCNKFLNPLLRGISYGRFMQTALLLLQNISYVVDCLRYLVGSFREVPPWSLCSSANSSCIPAEDVLFQCTRNKTIPFNKTSAFHHYAETFSTLDRNAMTTRLFMTCVVWMIVFFIASVTEETIIKIYRFTFVGRSMSTLITISFILISTDNVATEAFSIILDISGPTSIMVSLRHVCYAYGIGLMGLYDFGSMSPYTMIDTAAVIFVAAFTLLAFLRSWIVKILFLVMTKCVAVEKRLYSPHVLFYAILPFTTEFLHAHKLYIFYLYGNMLLGTVIYVTNLVLVLSKFLSYEFRSVKQIYIVGLLCCIGFAFSVPLLIFISTLHRSCVLTAGIDTLTTYLGSVYVAIVMWLYGLGKFATDIQFWLAFRPTRFWTISWALLPVPLFASTIASVVEIIRFENSKHKWSAIGWIIFTLAVVGIMNIKVMTGFLMRNNLAALFISNKNYGPPDSEDRKRRLYYSECTRQRKCRHHCLVIDDWFDCNHQAITLDKRNTLSSSSSETSLLNLYDSKTSSRLRSISTLPPAAHHAT